MSGAIDLFMKQWGRPNPRATIVNETTLTQAPNESPMLVELWQRVGIGAFGDGAFWLVDPAHLQHQLDEWTSCFRELEALQFRPFARTAFGSMFAFSERTEAILTVQCENGTLYIDGGALDSMRAPKQDEGLGAFLATLQMDVVDTYDDNEELLFQRALDRLGPLDECEIYGFEPILPLGGAAVIENRRKVRMDVHVDILRALCEPRLVLL